MSGIGSTRCTWRSAVEILCVLCCIVVVIPGHVCDRYSCTLVKAGTKKAALCELVIVSERTF